ncbi:hypothetical protein AYR62_15820 (plasmid) [Secundilactobacillus paracollinoides]|uniref:DUF1351 domain-containing protein n=1 Tax=Secundilactobacillus paracollinoides TaxID=240427 RepID=UPI00081AAA89|nr:DUF1351 domain-containing protein [Secundilactobacillus paracollinoides]ANZ65552.1 hypothetical protein AYR62_15820 [Secundilactobacillus paracollinoides]
MSNEAQALQLPDYSIEYTPTQIKIHNYDGLMRAATAYAERYANEVITETTEADVKVVRAQLNKVQQALDDKRKEIKRGFNQPYNDFAELVKQLREPINTTIAQIDDGLDELKVQQREQKKQHVQSLIDEMAPNYQVLASEIEIDPKWLNKTVTDKQIEDGIAGTMVQLKKAQDKLQTDITTVTKYATAQGVDPDGWVDQVKQSYDRGIDSDVTYLLSGIDKAVERKTQQQQNVEAKAAEERTHQKQQGNAIVDTNTGEVVSKQYTLKITGTTDQMWTLRHYMDQQGIMYEKA